MFPARHTRFASFVFASCVLLACLPTACGVVVDTGTARNVDGLSTLDRFQYFNVHSSPGTTWRPEDIDLFAHDLNAGLGRAFVFSSRMATCKASPTVPGFVDPQSLEKACTSYPPELDGWPAGAVDLIHSSKTGQEYANGCGGVNKGFSPMGNHSGAADFFTRYVNNCTLLTTQPRLLVEVANECNVKVGRCNTTWSDMIQLHVAVADALHANAAAQPELPRPLVAGPTRAYPEDQIDDFRVFKQALLPFLQGAGHAVDLLSVHLYDTYDGVSNTPFIRTGSNVVAELDLQLAASLNVTGVAKKALVSEYGSGFRNKSMAYSPMHDWQVLRGVTGKLFTFLERGDVVKSVPFIVGKATWYDVVGDVQYPWVLWHRNGSDWTLTHLVKFYELFAHVEGRRVVATSSNTNVLVHAFDNSTDLFVCVHNLEDGAVSVPLTVEAMPLASSVTVSRLLLLNGEPTLEVTTPAGLPSSLTLSPHETVVVRAQHDSAAPKSTLVETSHVSPIIVSPITPSGVGYDFDVAGNGTVAWAKLRLGLAGNYSQWQALGGSGGLKVSVNGEAQVFDLQSCVAGTIHVQPKDNSFMLSASIDVPAQTSSAVVVSSGVPVTVSSAVLVVAQVVDDGAV